jgi:hypothetical protein
MTLDSSGLYTRFVSLHNQQHYKPLPLFTRIPLHRKFGLSFLGYVLESIIMFLLQAGSLVKCAQEKEKIVICSPFSEKLQGNVSNFRRI